MIGRVSSPRFVGRREELAILASAWQRAAAGEGSAVLVGAEAGMGKSRLVAELAEQARAAGAMVIVGECLPLGEGELPYAPIVSALRALARLRGEGIETLAGASTDELSRLLPELEPVATDGVRTEGSQGRLFEQLLSVLIQAAREAPLVLVVEDVHWSDRSTRDFLGFLVRAARHEPLAVIVTYRSDELERGHPARAFLIELERSGQAARIALTPFGREEIGEQAAAILGAVPEADLLARLVARAEGNPFFAEELLAFADPQAGGGEGRLPESLRDALLSRVEQRSATAHAVLRIGSVAGREFDHALLEAVAGIPASELTPALRETIDNHVLVTGPSGQGYAFRHALLREAVYADLLPGERRALHLTIARALQQRPEMSGAETTAAAELAHHFHAAGELGEALSASLEAASRAEAVHASGEALLHYERALELWDQVQPDADPLAIMRRAAAVAELSGSSDRSIEIVERMLERFDPGDRIGLALGHERLGRYLWTGGRGEDALPQYRRAVELMPPEPSVERATVLAAEAQALMLCGHNEASIAQAEEALAIARALGARAVEANVLNTMCPNSSYRGLFEQAVAAGRQALALAQEVGSVEEMGRGYVNTSDALDQAGRMAESIELAQEGVRVADELGADRQYGDFLRAELGSRLMRTGAWDAAGALLADLAERGGSVGVVAGMIHEHHAQLQAERGDYDGAARSLREAAAHIGRAGGAMWSGPLALGRAVNELWAGRPEAATRAVDECLTGVGVGEYLFFTARVYELGIRACADLAASAPGDEAVASREQARATQLLARLDDAIAHLQGEASPRVAAGRTACAAERSRIDGPDPAAWAAAQRSWLLLGDRYQAAYAGWRRAEALLLAGDRREVAELVAGAHAVATELGARPLREAVEALARRARVPLGVASPAAAGTALDDERLERRERLERLELTPRELEVLSLLGEGLTNREIAAELFISDKTASVHVSRILGKLSVANRAGAAAAAQRLGVVRVTGD